MEHRCKTDGLLLLTMQRQDDGWQMACSADGDANPQPRPVGTLRRRRASEALSDEIAVEIERRVANGGCKTGRAQLGSRLRSHAFHGSPGAAICGRPRAFPDADGWRGGAMRGRAGDRPPHRPIRWDQTAQERAVSMFGQFARVLEEALGALFHVESGQVGLAPTSLQGRDRPESSTERGRGDRHFQGRPLSGEFVPPSLPSSSTGVVRPGPNGHGGSRPALSIRRNTGPLVEKGRFWPDQPISAQSRHKSAQTRQVFEPIAGRSRDLLTVSRMLMLFGGGSLSGQLDRQPPHLHLRLQVGVPPSHLHAHIVTSPLAPPLVPRLAQPALDFSPACRSSSSATGGTVRRDTPGQRCLTGAHPLSPPLFRPNSPPMARRGSRWDRNGPPPTRRDTSFLFGSPRT
jgi:hypothetical protein